MAIPSCWAARCWTAFLAAPETSNAQDVEHEHQSEIEYFPLDDPLIALNVDTPEQYAALSDTACYHALPQVNSQLRPNIS